MLTTLSMVAEMELSFITEQRRPEIEAAKGKGVYKGAARQADYTKVRELIAVGLPNAAVARRCGISRETVYKVMKTPA